MPFLCGELARPIVGSIIRRCQRRWPFTIDAIVLLPDHLHAIWTLPPNDEAYSMRWGWIKKEFTKHWHELGGLEQPVSPGRAREGRRGVWQPKFWEHTLETETDFERHFDYVHYNPVKHALAKCPRDWRWSSFHRWVRAGVYEKNWACGDHEPPIDFGVIDDSVGE